LGRKKLSDEKFLIPTKMNYPGSLLVLFLLLLSCKPNPVEKLSGKWKPVEVTGEGLSPEAKAVYLQDGNMMEFTKDGKFITFSNGSDSDTGSYILSEDGKTLKVRTATGHQTQFNINELKTNRTIIEKDGIELVLEPAK
jgi:hypothetical protein